MLSVFTSPTRYTQGKGATAALGREITTLGLEGPVLIIAGKTAIGLLAKVWQRSLEDVDLKHAVHRFGGECSLIEIERVKVAGAAAAPPRRHVRAGPGGRVRLPRRLRNLAAGLRADARAFRGGPAETALAGRRRLTAPRPSEYRAAHERHVGASVMTRTSGGGGAVDFFWQPLANKSAAKIKKPLQLLKKVVVGRNPAFIIYFWNAVLGRSATARTLYLWPPSCQQALGRGTIPPSEVVDPAGIRPGRRAELFQRLQFLRRQFPVNGFEVVGRLLRFGRPNQHRTRRASAIDNSA